MFFLYIPVKGSSHDILWTLSDIGESVTVYKDCVFDPLEPVNENFQKLEQFLLTHNYDCLISDLFVPEISDVCEKYHCKYIGWVYDSPLVPLFHKSVRNPCNYLFIFDHKEYEYFTSYGIPHLYYLPLAANIARTGMIDITAEDEQQFSCDISFVGNLYRDNSYNALLPYFSEDIKCEFKLYLLRNLCKWSKSKPWPRVSQAACDFMRQTFQAENWVHMDMDLDLFIGIAVLSRKLAELDRITVLNTLAELHSVHLYTYSDHSYLDKVHVHPGIDYEVNMNKIFYLSKINLNITLPSIETGIPQRIFDILGCGGFLLTNYQEELEDLFVIGEDLEVYRDLDELKEKTAYYLQHEKERIKIAMNGYQKVRKYHSYTNRMKHILKIMEEET